MSLMLRLQIAASIAISSAAIFGIAYLAIGMPNSLTGDFLGAVVPFSLAGGVIVAILARQLFKRISEQ